MADGSHSNGSLEGGVSSGMACPGRFFHPERGTASAASRLRARPSAFPSVKHQSGFSLLEVVVAFAILALSLGVLMQLFSRALGTTALSRDYSRATTLAQARLDAVGIDIPLEAGSYGGEPEDGFSWQLTVEPYPLRELAWEPGFDVFLVTSMVSWDEGREAPRWLSLSSLRLGGRSGLPGLPSAGARGQEFRRGNASDR
jgi:general secretion pathway protein I